MPLPIPYSKFFLMIRPSRHFGAVVQADVLLRRELLMISNLPA